MITIKQIAPEYQDADFFLDDDFYRNNILIAGYGSYNEYGSERLLKLRREYEDDIDSYYTSADASELYKGYIAGGASGLSCKEFEAILDRSDIDGEARYISFRTGQNWKALQIHGSCQSEWENILYNADVIDRHMIRDFETAWFNEGSEWEFADGEDSFVHYSVEWNEYMLADELKEVARDCFGNDEVEILKFAGWTRTAQYERM